MQEGNNAYRGVIATIATNPDLITRMMRLRHTLFVEERGWDLGSRDGLEQDEFDRDDTVHVGLFRGAELVGGFRAIRTDRPYLAATVFPTLASVARYPKRASAWEISRFGVRQQDPREAGRDAGRANYALMFRFAELRRATTLVAIADPTYERFLSSLGIRSRRYGPPQHLGRDATGRPLLLVAGDIPVLEQRGPGFERLISLARNLEVVDETLVLGREAISA